MVFTKKIGTSISKNKNNIIFLKLASQAIFDENNDFFESFSNCIDKIEKEVVRLATKARDGKLSIDEMKGGTFTITNGGIFGSMLSTPIINSPQSAILGMHNIVKRGVVLNDELVVRPMMYLALSYDHRIIDGRESVSFLVRVKELLEDPSRLMLNI